MSCVRPKSSTRQNGCGTQLRKRLYIIKEISNTSARSWKTGRRKAGAMEHISDIIKKKTRTGLSRENTDTWSGAAEGSPETTDCPVCKGARVVHPLDRKSVV